MDSELDEIGDVEPGRNGEETGGDGQDLLPEYCHYRDEGCELADSCLGCPLPHCVYDEPRGKQHLFKERRDREIARLFSGGGRGIKELAAMFGLSRRTIQRALRRSLNVSGINKVEAHMAGKTSHEGDGSRDE